jgi:hypothetical protein
MSLSVPFSGACFSLLTASRVSSPTVCSGTDGMSWTVGRGLGGGDVAG